MLSPILTGLGSLAELCHLLSVSFSSLWLSISVIKVMRIFSCSSWGRGPSHPSNDECHKQRNSLWISLLCFYVQGELGFWLLKDWSSSCISFEYFVVACSADLSFPGCMRKWYDIVWLHEGPGLWCLACYIASHNMVSLLSWWTNCQKSLKCQETFSNFMYLVLILLVSSILKFLTLFWLVSGG